MLQKIQYAFQKQSKIGKTTTVFGIIIVISFILQTIPVTSQTVVVTDIVYLPIAYRTEQVVQIAEIIYAARDEVIMIANYSDSALVLDGWQVESVVGSQVYQFPLGLVLAVGDVVRIHSGPEAWEAPPTDLLWHYGYIWNNTGDMAELINGEGEVVYSFCYEDGC